MPRMMLNMCVIEWANIFDRSTAEPFDVSRSVTTGCKSKSKGVKRQPGRGSLSGIERGSKASPANNFLDLGLPFCHLRAPKQSDIILV